MNDIDNPYWSVLKPHVSESERWHGRAVECWYTFGLYNKKFEWGRESMVHEYSFAIPDPEVLSIVASLSPIVELGAGTGYWVYLLRQLGVDIVAYDNGSWEKTWKRKWTTISRGTPSVLGKHSDRALLLCWPDYNKTFALRALKAYTGNVVLYIGECQGGCNATDGFFNLLDEEFTVQNHGMVNWYGIHDRISVCRRNGKR